MASSTRKLLVELPKQLKLDGRVNAVFDRFNMAQFEEVKSWFKEAAAKGQGYSEEEAADEYLIKEFKYPTLSCTDLDTNELMGVFNLRPSPMNRSIKKLLASSWTIVKPGQRGMGIAMEWYRIAQDFGIDQGYVGGTARMAITSRNIVPSRAAGLSVTGIIPHCTPLAKMGYMDDVLLFTNFHVDRRVPSLWQELVESRNKPLPPLVKSSEAEKFLWNGKTRSPHETTSKIGTLQIRSPKGLDELLEVETFWRHAAERGQGFGLDEFTEDGYFNRCFLRESNILVAENVQGELVGTSIFGPSDLSRAPKPIISQLYVAVHPGHGGEGIGRALLKYSMDCLKEDGFKGVISDTFTSNHPMLQLLRQLDYSSRGSLPMVAYLKNQGVTESLIVYRDL